MDYTGMCSKPTLPRIGKCGKGGKGGDGSCLEDEDQCVDDFGGTFCPGKGGGKGKKGKKDGKER